MSIPWSQITPAELAEETPPSAITFAKLVNNPRAVLYGDETVPASSRVFATGCRSPDAGASGDFLLSDGHGAVLVGQITFGSLLLGVTYQPVIQTNYTPFPTAGVYTLLLWGNGGAGASSLSPSGYANPGGAGGFVKAYVQATDLTEIVVGGFVAGANAFVREVGNAWRLDASPGAAGVATDTGRGASGEGSLQGFARGFGISGGVRTANYGGPSPGAVVANGGVQPFGLGGKYNVAGLLGGLLIARGVH